MNEILALIGQLEMEQNNTISILSKLNKKPVQGKVPDSELEKKYRFLKKKLILANLELLRLKDTK